MGKETKIQWCDSTINPTMGCDGCELWNPDTGTKTCYAGTLHEMRGATNPGFSPRFDIVTLHPGRTAEAAKLAPLTGRRRPGEPWKDGLPRLIFVADMSDALSKDVSFEYLLPEIIDVVGSRDGQRHLWLWPSKRPDRMAKFSQWLKDLGIDWPSNLWPGTSITTAGTRSRINHLREVGNEQTVRFLSVEPQFEAISFKGKLDGIHWMIQGGASGADAKPFDEAWAEQAIEDCREADVAYFLKQMGQNPHRNGEPYKLIDQHGGNWLEWPDHLKIREFPKLTSKH